MIHEILPLYRAIYIVEKQIFFEWAPHHTDTQINLYRM